MSENGNGNGVQAQAGPQLIITVTDLAEFKLGVSGTYPSLDYALNMLDQARRELEAGWRVQRMQIELQKRADQALANSLMAKR